jgi:hypothetical protein
LLQAARAALPAGTLDLLCFGRKSVMGHASWVMRAFKTRQGSGVSGQAWKFEQRPGGGMTG